MDIREKALIMDEEKLRRSLIRIAHEVIEKNKDLEDIILVGIAGGGLPLAKRLANIIENLEGIKIPVGVLDITAYRDDRRREGVKDSLKSNIPGEIDNKTIILVDDVLYTGRTVRAALDALVDIGRPNAVELAVLIDRGHREFPIRADFIGKNVPTSKKEFVEVKLLELDGEDAVRIIEKSGEKVD